MDFKWIKWMFFCSMGVGVGFLHLLNPLKPNLHRF